jgi:hypothetical protein
MRCARRRGKQRVSRRPNAASIREVVTVRTNKPLAESGDLRPLDTRFKPIVGNGEAECDALSTAEGNAAHGSSLGQWRWVVERIFT